MDEYRSKTIDEATPLELLHALVHCQGLAEGPHKRVFHAPVLEALVEIGDDATASILIFEDDLDVLNRLVLGGGDDRLY